MKIVCDACEAKYFVADDKIQKRAVRLTCQKCGNVIIARRDEPMAGADDLRARLGLAGEGSAAPGRSGPPPLPAAPAEWYYSRDGQSYGPFTRAALVGSFEDGSLGEECYVWHRSLGDWLAAHSTAPFDAIIGKRAPSEPEPVRSPFAGSALGAAAGAAARAGASASGAGATVPEVGQSSPKLGSLRARLGALDAGTTEAEEAEEKSSIASLTPGGSAFEAPVEAPDPDADAPPDATVPDSLEIDLDVDGASRVIDINMLRGPSGESLRADDDDVPAKQDLDVSLDLDVDGASRVVSIADIMASAKADATEVDETDRPSWVPEDLAALDRNVNNEVLESGGERSMLIHLDHLKQQNRTSKWYAIGGIAALLVIGVGLWVVIANTSTDVDAERSGSDAAGRSLSARAGAEIDAAEFERVAPLADFSMVDAGDDQDDEPEGAADSAVTVAESGSSAPKRRPRIGESPRADGGGGKDPSGGSSAGSPSDGGPSLSDLTVEKRNDGATEVAALSPGEQETSAALKDRSGPSYGGGTGSRRDRRGRVDLSGQTTGFEDVDTKHASKYGGSGIKAADRNRFVSGLRKVSKSVMDCQRRQLDREGPLSVKKVYIKITVEPDGSVSKIKPDKAVAGTYFEKCLNDLKGRWKFATFEGKPVQLRQGFVLE